MAKETETLEPIDTEEQDSDNVFSGESGMLSGLRRFRNKLEKGEVKGNNDDIDPDDEEQEDVSGLAGEYGDDDLDLDFSGVFGDEEKEERPKNKEEPPEKLHEEDQPEEDDDINIDELTTEDGKPISQKAAEAFKSLKRKAKSLEDQISQLNEEKKSFKPIDEYSVVEKERDDLRKQLDLLDFRSSEDFKGKFHKPVQDAIKDATRWVSTIPEKYTQEASLELRKAQNALASGNESAFFEAVDEINQHFLQGSRGGRFVASMNKLWDANESKLNAEKDMELARDEIVKGRQKMSQSSERIIEATMGSAVEQFSQKNKAVLDFYRSDRVKDKFKVDEILKAAPDKNKKMLQDFLSTGRASEELSSILLAGSMEQLRNTERELLLGSLHNFQKQLLEAHQELEQYKGKMKKVSSRRGSVSSGSSNKDDNNESEEDDGGGYGLLAGIRKLRQR